MKKTHKRAYLQTVRKRDIDLTIKVLILLSSVDFAQSVANTLVTNFNIDFKTASI